MVVGQGLNDEKGADIPVEIPVLPTEVGRSEKTMTIIQEEDMEETIQHNGTLTYQSMNNPGVTCATAVFDTGVSRELPKNNKQQHQSKKVKNNFYIQN